MIAPVWAERCRRRLDADIEVNRAGPRDDGRAADLLERLHDVRVVRAPEKPARPRRGTWRRSSSWGIALFEYLLQVPANRIGYTALTLSQLKILQEVITLSVFVPFAVLYMKQPLKLDFLWAGLCLVGAVYFMFRG